jgi:hypothetical protein
MTQKAAVLGSRIYCTFEQWLYYNPKGTLKGFLRWARRLGYKVVELDVRDSADRSS